MAGVLLNHVDDVQGLPHLSPQRQEQDHTPGDSGGAGGVGGDVELGHRKVTLQGSGRRLLRPEHRTRCEEVCGEFRGEKTEIEGNAVDS